MIEPPVTTSDLFLKGLSRQCTGSPTVSHRE
jgi:hypothetical protein